jgi:intracellular multiplication protein IcmB
MVAFFDEIVGGILGGLRQPLESFIQLETADDSQTLATADGSLVTFVRISGARQMIGDAEYEAIVDRATMKLGTRFDRPGHALQVYFMREPDRVGAELHRLMRANMAAARASGLDLDDLLEERERHLAKFMAWEEIFFVLWTRPSALTDPERKKAQSHRRDKKWIAAKDAQYPHAALDALRLRHKAFTSSMMTSLEELGIHARLTEVHEALRAVRTSLFPSRFNDSWKACLPGDPMPPRMPRNGTDPSDVLWPPLRRQLAAGEAETLSPTAVRIGDMIWAGADMSLAPQEPAPFPQLLNRLIDSNMPFRVSMLIESGGAASLHLKKFVTSVLGFTNDENKQIKYSLDSLIDRARDEPIVRLRVSMATCAPKDDPKLLDQRLSALVQSVESWGYCQVAQLVGDPLECVLSSALGIACASTAPAAGAPLREVMRLLPWQRASSPFEDGPILFRTVDGRVWPYQVGSSLTTTWFDLIFAQPGAGKSVLMNALSLGTCLSAGNAQLPYIAILDIGPSSSGLISLIRDAMPPEKRHLAAHFRLRMTPEYAVNPFDTQLGNRYPLPEERSFLIELLTLLCTSPGQDQPYDGMNQLVGLCIDEMYRWRDDSAANAEARPYLRQIEHQVDKALETHGIQLPVDPYWWDVVDALFDKGAIHEAMLAQRHAMPTLADAVTAARRPQIRALLEETSIGASSEGVIHAFERMVASAVREFPILASITRFDIGQARICAVDLADVAPQGDDTANRQTAVMYMLARHTLIRSWWVSPDAIRAMPQRYRPYHEARIQEIRETPKRICFDEFHRTGKTPAVRAQIVRDVREGRKWGVQIVLASQLLEDFSDDMVDLATGIWICGATVSDRVINTTAERFGLSETAKWVMRYRLTGPRPTGAPVLLILGTNEGRYEQHLINTLGPIELWALSSSAEDVAVRTQLYGKLGAIRARRVLASVYPGGSARPDIKRRVAAMVDSGEVESGATTAVIAAIVAELVTLATPAALRQLAAASLDENGNKKA